MADVFLSYVHDDRARAEQLATALAQLGWDVWWDRKIVGGHSFRKVIDAELESAKCIVVLWSQKSVESNYVLDEADDALRLGRLVSTAIENVRAPRGFRQQQIVDLTTWNGDQSARQFKDLTLAIKQHVPRGSQVPALRDSAANDLHTDIAISYAALDDVPEPDGRPGWTTHFHRTLERRLTELLGRKARTWRNDLRFGDASDRSLGSNLLKHVAVLVVVLSPHYIQSERTRHELEDFFDAARERRDLKVHRYRRIVTVVKTPIPQGDMLMELPLTSRYHELFTEDPVTLTTRELRPDDERSEDYFNRIGDVANDIYEVLARLFSPTVEDG
jgi:hypothetical protein